MKRNIIHFSGTRLSPVSLQKGTFAFLDFSAEGLV